ncbi:MAG: anaerobic ribonucleoside-triphosphate reductase activating protein [Oscillospiraceae bacterium]|nr:anaerobic ribonucleoside-triphosphate reductase activating protein [Oscillospiraceae bacterium]
MLDLAGIVNDSIVDGPGIRMTVFAQGCPHHCHGCHNPETWQFGCGTPMEEERIADIVATNPLCRGVTFSGGEPFAQAEGFAKLAQLLKARGYEVASYSGYTFEQLINGTDAQKELLQSIDVLIDGPFIMAQRSLEVPFRGSRNQRIIDVKQSLTAGKPVCITTGRWAGEY